MKLLPRIDLRDVRDVMFIAAAFGVLVWVILR